NCADAALGAYLVRRISQTAGPFRFRGLRSMIVFAAFGATLPTILLSFADAGISVATAWTTGFHAAFITRVRSNILTHLIVVPALVDLAVLDWRRLRSWRALEVGILWTVLFAVCAAAFTRPAGSETFPAVLYTPLPLLLWAAVRFGPGGTGASLLIVATVASWEALQGRGPFTLRSPLEDVISLQLFLLASATPLLFLSAVIRERNDTTRTLQRREAALRHSYARVRKLAGTLITAQEQERARLARDMHDDFNQQLAAVAIGIGTLRQRAAGGDAEVIGLLQTLQERTVALSDQVRQFSHDLHPSMLDHVGLAPALRTHCSQMSQQHELQVQLVAGDDLAALPRDVAICVYRIVQEGLRNVLNHARVSSAMVAVHRSLDRLEVTIADRGCGFDPQAAAAHAGLGLLSIEERARLVGGTLSIESAPGQGTTLQVSIPVAGA
ncbi:MAG TPA: sensor histidine kinase, partial [Vicinamibacterales bacterium]|nr:sensor histidine kinase [Vicinamibacterales bacterium]